MYFFCILPRCDVCVPIDASKQDDNTSDVVEECIVQPFNSSNNSNDFNSKY